MHTHSYRLTPGFTIARYLRERRAECQLSQSELARRTGVTRYRISRFESNRAIPNPRQLCNLVAELNMPFSEAFGCAGYAYADRLPLSLDQRYRDLSTADLAIVNNYIDLANVDLPQGSATP